MRKDGLPTELPRSPDPVFDGYFKVPSVEDWCKQQLRQDNIPFRCAPEVDNELTPEQRAACEDEGKLRVLEARFFMKKVDGLTSLWISIPALNRSEMVTKSMALDRHYSSLKSFPKIRYAQGQVFGDMIQERVGICSTEGKLLLSSISFDLERPGMEQLTTIQLPPRTRVRIPSFKFVSPGWSPSGSRCRIRFDDARDLCEDGCERKFADGWGVLNSVGVECRAACTDKWLNSIVNCDPP